MMLWRRWVYLRVVLEIVFGDVQTVIDDPGHRKRGLTQHEEEDLEGSLCFFQSAKHSQLSNYKMPLLMGQGLLQMSDKACIPIDNI